MYVFIAFGIWLHWSDMMRYTLQAQEMKKIVWSSVLSHFISSASAIMIQ